VYVSFEVFVRPALMKMMGRTDARATVVAVLDGELDAPRTRARYARVRVRHAGDGSYVATPEGGHQSNLLATFARADGLVRLEPGQRIGANEACTVTLIRDVTATAEDA
jgi:molybdopterin biosynthesis enzyme